MTGCSPGVPSWGQRAPWLCPPLPSDITEEDLEEAGVRDPGHKRVLLESLQLRK